MKKMKLTLDELKNQVEVLDHKKMSAIVGGEYTTGYGTGYGTGTGYGIDINDPSKPMYGGAVSSNDAVQALDANPYA